MLHSRDLISSFLVKEREDQISMATLHVIRGIAFVEIILEQGKRCSTKPLLHCSIYPLLLYSGIFLLFMSDVGQNYQRLTERSMYLIAL